MFRFQRRRFQWWVRQLTDRQINAFARVGVATVLVVAAAVVGINLLNRSDTEATQGQAAGVEQLLPGNGLPEVPAPETVASTAGSTTQAATTTQSTNTTVEVLAAAPETTEGRESQVSETPVTATTPTTVPTTAPPAATTVPPSTVPPTTTAPTTTVPETTTTSPTTTTVPSTSTTSPTTTLPDGQLVVGSITPSQMQAGTTISAEITGSGFLPGLSVTFSGGDGRRPRASNYDVSPDRITFNVRVRGGGPDRDRVWVVTVNNPNGQSASLGSPFIVTPPDDDD